MRAFIAICLLVSVGVFAHRSHRSTSSPNSATWHEAEGPSDCALYPMMTMEDDEESKMSSNYNDMSNNYFYDAGQFMKDGGFYRAQLNGPIYYFSLCAEHPQANATAACVTADSAVCYAGQSNTAAKSLGLFSEMEWRTKDTVSEGYLITFANPKTISAQCPNGTSVTFVMNCTVHYDPETNYTVTSVEPSTCSHTVYINSLAACPIYNVASKQHPRVPIFLLMVLGSLAVIVVICSCCLMCYACCLSRRERCQKKKDATCAKKVAPVSAPVVPVAQPQRNIVPQPIQPRAQPQQQARPQPPVTPPPMYPMMQQQQQQYQPQQPQQMYMPNNVAYPNLYTGGYVPLVPMMAQPQQPQQAFNTNPFMVPMADTRIASRQAQLAEDERLARMLQAQYNGQV